MELNLKVMWCINTTSSGKLAVEGWLPGQEVYPGIRIIGFNGGADQKGIRDRNKQSVLTGNVPMLMRYIMQKEELDLDMCFEVEYPRSQPNKYGYVNNRIKATWKGSDGTIRTGSFGPYNYNVNSNMSNGPQWLIDGEYVDIISGGLHTTFKALVELAHKEVIGDKQKSLIAAYKKKSRKSKLTKKLRKELNSMLPCEGSHTARCTKCGLFNSGDHTYSCSLGVWQPFLASELTPDVLERNGVTSTGGHLQSIRPDTIKVWMGREDEVMDKIHSFESFLKVGSAIDASEGISFGGVHDKFVSWERFWDDCFWIDRLAVEGLLETCTDLDVLIAAHRDPFVKKLAQIQAKKYPEFEHIFLQRAADPWDTKGQKAQMDVINEERTESSTKVTELTFMDTAILTPCGLGFKTSKNKAGKYVSYIHRGYPIPEKFGIVVVEK